MRRSLVGTGIVVGLLAGAVAPAGARLPHVQLGGYVRVAAGGLHSVDANIRVASVVCPADGAPSEGVALGVVVYSVDGASTSAAVEVTCSGGVAAYTGVLTLDGERTPLVDAIQPGDFMHLTAAINSPNASANLRDATAHWSDTVAGASPAASEIGAGAIALNCSADGCTPVPEFAAQRFTSLRFDDRNPLRTHLHRSSIKAADGSVEANGSNITSRGSYSVHWRSTCSPVDASGRC